MRDPLALLRAILPDGVQAAGGPVAALQGPLWPAERATVARARDTRLAEFTAGRTAARRLIGDRPLPRGTGGAPLWPPGTEGSISHAGGWALAVAGPGPRRLGLDLERLGAALPLAEIATPDEIAALGAADPVRLFSAKEAAYKAQFPLTGALIGFHDLAVALRGDGFDATFTRDVPPFAAGDRIAGRQAAGGGFVVSLAWTGP